MSSTIYQARVRGFRDVFQFAGNINWFPGHMRKTAKQMVKEFDHVDMVLEVRDARIPFSSSNFVFDGLLRDKPRLVIFNKADLACPLQKPVIERMFHAKGQQVLFTSATKGANIAELVPAISSLISPQFNSLGVMFLIMGIPNVGKSTIINSLRMRSNSMNLGQSMNALSGPMKKIARTKVSKVGNEPGVTRHLQPFLVHKNPVIYLVDSPGVMAPKIADIETGLKLTLTGAIKSHLVGFEILADYALFTMNRMKNFNYVPALKLDRPTDDIVEVLEHLQTTFGDTTEFGSQRIVTMFRDGSFGRMSLDGLDGMEVPSTLHFTDVLKENKCKRDVEIQSRRDKGITMNIKRGGSHIV